MKTYSEADVFDAITAVRDGMGKREASRTWHIPYTTLRRRLLGTPNHRDAANAQRLLSDYQEDQLAVFLINQAALGLALTRYETRALAARMAYPNEHHAPLGKQWLRAFFIRHPMLRSRKSRRVEAIRLRAANKKDIGTWFALLELPIVKGIKPDNRWNADEGGLMEGRSENALTIGYSDDSPLLQKDFNSRAWTSFLECISATGKFLVPLIIFKGLSIQQQWFPIALEDHDGWQFTATKKGWMEERIAIEWLRRVFIPQTAPEDPSDWRLLVIDGHHTHTTIDFMWECFSHRIYIIFLPAHTSHVLQPLDVAVFHPLKEAFRKHLHHLGQFDTSTVMAKKRFLYCYHRARMEALTEQNIRSGWRGAGLWPVSRRKALQNKAILENHQKKKKSSKSSGKRSFIGQFATPQTLSRSSEPIFATPKRSQEMRGLVARYVRQKHSSPTQRLLFRKLLKGYDEKEHQLTMTSQKTEALEAQVEATKKTKRKKVQLDPNEVFADIEAIRRAQIEVGRVSEESEESEESETPTEEGSCIVVVGN